MGLRLGLLQISIFQYMDRRHNLTSKVDPRAEGGKLSIMLLLFAERTKSSRAKRQYLLTCRGSRYCLWLWAAVLLKDGRSSLGIIGVNLSDQEAGHYFSEAGHYSSEGRAQRSIIGDYPAKLCRDRHWHWPDVSKVTNGQYMHPSPRSHHKGLNPISSGPVLATEIVQSLKIAGSTKLLQNVFWQIWNH